MCIDSGVIVSIVDSSFEVLEEITVDQSGFPRDYCINDPRLFQVYEEGQQGEDEILIGFNPDLGMMSTDASVARLTFESLTFYESNGKKNLVAKVSEPLISIIATEDSAHKNMGMILHEGVVYGIDSIAPLSSYPILHVNGMGVYLPAFTANKYELRSNFERVKRQFHGWEAYLDDKITQEPASRQPLLRDAAYDGVTSVANKDGDLKFGQSTVHGNVPPINLPDGMLLNIGHIYRSYGLRAARFIMRTGRNSSSGWDDNLLAGRYGQLYLHHFILMNAKPPFSVSKVGTGAIVQVTKRRAEIDNICYICE